VYRTSSVNWRNGTDAEGQVERRQRGTIMQPVAEFKEFKRRFKFKPRFKYGWFLLKLYQMFQDLNWRLI